MTKLTENFFSNFFEIITTKSLFINSNCRNVRDTITLEFDYTSLYPVLAYVKIGIDISINIFDAYDVPFDRIKDKNDLRKILKSLFLTVLNAKNEKECFKAFRNQWNYKEKPCKGIFSDTF